MPTTYKRVLLKLSGEEFGGGKLGVDPDVVARIAREIAAVSAPGTEIAVVIGGGNFFRGAELRQRGMNGVRADYMGMLGIVMNCLALQEFLEQRHVVTRVQTAIAMGQIAEPYVPLRAIRHLEKGRVVIFGAGMGLPFFTTDTVAVQRALETHCDAVLFTKNGVDGVYSADPKLDPDRHALRPAHLRGGDLAQPPRDRPDRFHDGAGEQDRPDRVRAAARGQRAACRPG